MSMTVLRKHVNILNGFNKVKQQTEDTSEGNMKSKVGIIGTGMVGMSYAYSMVNQGTCEELVLIDINKEKTEGEAIDLNHGLSFAPRKMKIYSGDYSDLSDAALVCITAGPPPLEGETRLDTIHKSIAVMKNIISNLKQSEFKLLDLTE